MAVFLALATVLFQLIAVPSSADSGQLLSYAELMRLPRDQRTAYIQGVRNILIELSKNPDAKFSDVDPGKRSRLKAWLEFIDSQVIAADARESQETGSPKTCSENRQCEVALRDCFLKKSSLVKWNASSGVYECDTSRPIGSLRAMSAMGDMDDVLRRIARGPDPQFSKEVAPVIRLGRPRPQVDSEPPRSSTAAAAVPLPGEAEVIRVRPRADTNRALFGNSRKSLESISGYAEEVARGRVSGLRCRSKFLPQASTAESRDWSALSECTEAQESKLQEKFESQRSPVLKALAEPPPSDAPPAAAPIAAAPAVAEARPVSPGGALDSRPLTLAETRPRPEHGRKIMRSEIQPFIDRRENPDKVCEAERSTLGDGKLVFVPTAQGEAHGYCMTESNYERYKNGDFDPDRTEQEAASPPAGSRGLAASERAGDATGAVGRAWDLNSKFAACAPKPQTCESRETIRKLYYQGNLPCVFAGMVSSLANGNRRCQAVTEYKIGDKTLKCETGQTMCNPMLFGTVLGSNPETPICVGRGQAVTEQCGKISNARDAELFLNRNVSGLQDKWDEFKRGLENTCKEGSVSAKFHCHECNLMNQRLFELHARLVKNPCETGVDDGVRSRIKDRSAPTAR